MRRRDFLCVQQQLYNLLGHLLSVVRLLLLDVQILCVLANDNHIDRLWSGHDGLDRADIGVKVKLFTQSNDGGGVALDGLSRGAHSSKERAIALLLENLNSSVGESLSFLLKRLEAGFEVDKIELEVEGGGESFEDAAASWDDFLANPVTWDEACAQQLAIGYNAVYGNP